MADDLPATEWAKRWIRRRFQVRVLSAIRAMSGAVVLACAISPSRAAAQEVYMAVGQIEKKDGGRVKEGDPPLEIETQIRTGSDAVLMLRYSWPSDRDPLYCVEFVVVGGSLDFIVPDEAKPGHCTFDATGKEMEEALSGVNPVGRAQFYGTARADDKLDAMGAFDNASDRKKIEDLLSAAKKMKDRQRKAREEIESSVGPTPSPESAGRLVPVGGSGGQSFVDSCDDVVEVHVREGYFIDAIQLICRGPGAQPVRGGTGGTESIFQLQPGEHITAVSGSAMGPESPFVFSLQLHTDQRSSPVYGNHGPTQGQVPFRFEIPAGSRFGGFWGQADRFLNALGVVIYGTP